MDGTLRTARRIALALFLAVGGVVATTGLSPASHAAPLPPSISVQYDGNYIYVSGSNFTPGGRVWIEAVSYTGVFITETSTIASATGGCSGYVCFMAGTIYTRMGVAPPPWTTVYVVAYDIMSGTWSNWAKGQLPGEGW